MTTLESTQPAETTRRGSKRGNGEGSIYYQSARERWCGALSLENGKRKMIYGHSRREVRDKLAAALEKRRQGIPFTPERLTVSSWLDHWLKTVVEHDREPTTYDAYEISIRLHIKPALGGLPLAKLQPEQIERWLHDMQAHGTGVRTRQFALARLRTALNLALKRGHVYRNVAELVEMPRSTQRRIAPPRKEDLRRLLDVIKDDRQQALITVALAVGLRRGEMLGLAWTDIDLENRTLTVRMRVNRVRGQGLLIRQGAKTSAGQRTVVLPQLIVQALRAHRRRQIEDRLAAGDRWKGPEYVEAKPTGFVFTSGVGTILEPRNVTRYFASVRQRAGLDEHTFHGLRHDFASLLLAAGVPGRVVMEMLGHSNYSLTANRYQHVPDELQREAADRMDTILKAVSN